jgi:hypothetical protein
MKTKDTIEKVIQSQANRFEFKKFEMKKGESDLIAEIEQLQLSIKSIAQHNEVKRIEL